MTAEIVLMNRESLAIAADSAVSVMGGQMDSPQKIFTSANKIFPLSKAHAVCFMIFNYATFMGIPWEIIFTAYQKKIGNLTFPTTEEYAKDFIGFLASMEDLVPPEGEEYYFITNSYNYYASIRQSFMANADQLVKTSGGISEEELLKVPDSTIQGLYDALIAAPFVTSMTEEDVTILSTQYDRALAQAIEKVFESLPLSDLSVRQLKSIPALFFTKSTGPLDILSNDFSGVVIAGFGEKDIFPSVFSFWVEGRLNKKLKYSEKKHATITLKNGAEIVPFAQHEMVDIFLSGMDSAFEQALIKTIAETLYSFPEDMIDSIEELSDEMKRRYKESFQTNTDEIMKNLTQSLENYRMANFIPIVNLMIALPKSDLAAMAESLVNLTSLKRKISMQVETVGGPVDVAVISKQDGFVWIKKKQYYPAALNIPDTTRGRENS